jgi:molybdate transport system ATP-binding protein
MIEIRAGYEVGAFDVEVTIEAESDSLALFGPSGAGKTTILNIVAGLLRPASGRIAIDGDVLFDDALGVDAPAQRRRIGYVFQEPRLFPHLSVARNLTYGMGYTKAADRFVALEAIVELLELGPLLARRPERLSGGEQRRVAIGRAFLVSPRLLLMDEPLTALDDARRLDVLAYVEKLRAAYRIPMLFVSHRLSEVERLADDIAMIEGGRLVAMRKGSAVRRPDSAEESPATS